VLIVDDVPENLALVPLEDGAVEVPDENRIVRQFDQLQLPP
jgi:hypothetical protein